MRKSRNIETEQQRQLRLEAEAIAHAEAMAMTELAQEHQEQLERAVQETKSTTRKKKD
jgi:membrane peptidoglycan carboxypeptidase